MSNEAIVLLAIAAFAAGMAVYHYFIPHVPGSPRDRNPER